MTKDDNPFGFPGPFKIGGRYYVDQRVTSHNQSGGITAHTVNMTPPNRALNDALRAQLRQMVPKDRAVEVQAPLGDGEAIRHAHEVWDFLVGEGYNMRGGGVSYHVWMPPPTGQYIELGEQGVAKVIVGHRLAPSA